MAKQKLATPQHEESSKSLPTITMTDVARILSTPDDALMAWFGKGVEDAREMRNEKASTSSAKKNQGLESASQHN